MGREYIHKKNKNIEIILIKGSNKTHTLTKEKKEKNAGRQGERAVRLFVICLLQKTHQPTEAGQKFEQEDRRKAADDAGNHCNCDHEVSHDRHRSGKKTWRAKSSTPRIANKMGSINIIFSSYS